MNLFNIGGQVAMVTGASKGLGKAMALGLAQAGANIALCARNEQDLDQARSELEVHGITARAYRMDVLDRASIHAAVDAVLHDFGRIDILVNNAGVNIRRPITEMTEAQWDLILDTNLKGYFLVAQAVAPAMIRQRKGKVINISSVMGTVAFHHLGAYAASKGGIKQLTKVMAIEWAGHGINVNAIGPTYFETPMVAALRNDPERYRFIQERTPMGRWGQPEELVGTLIFLASKASDFITGQTIHVDGGWTIW